MYKSTRSNIIYSSSEAILKGLADDGGLFIPESIKKIDFDRSWLEYDYHQISFKILKHFFSDFTDDEIKNVISKSYSKENFPDEIIKTKSFSNHTYLELYHGPTLAFKDMALTMLPHLMDVSYKKCNFDKKITILTATSGDTGGAALSGFSKSENIDIVVLYPNGGVSQFQEKQMLSFTNEKAKAFALNCNFDGCQSTVKKLFMENNNKDIVLSSANSINIGRLVPQIIYYFAGYIEMVNNNEIKFNDEINVCVPTGNFGNILASYIAKMIGLPIADFICASNKNNVLTEFFNSGKYDIKREFYKTNSPSMDILISSNLERLIALLSENPSYVNNLMKELEEKKEYNVSTEIFNKMKCFKSFYATEAETLNKIREVFENDGYLIDPHTAVAKACFDKYEGNSCKTMIVSTASPLKFTESIVEALNINSCNDLIYDVCDYCNIKMPKNVSKILESKKEKVSMSIDGLKNYIFNKSFQINVPATSANLACGFDVVGICFNIFNSFKFILSEEYKCIGFKKEYIDPNDNLIVQSYKHVFKKLGKEEQAIIVEQVKNDILECGGLGSSSSCIVAGVLAAGYVLNITDSKILLDMMIELEGHPDNVCSAYFGGLNASYQVDGQYKTIRYSVSPKLKFMVCCPDFKVETKMARTVLPEKCSYKDIVYDLSRIIHLPKAFVEGDLELLKDLLDDKLHEPYRINLIEDGNIILSEAKKSGYAGCISGSGASLLIVGFDYEFEKILSEIPLKHSWTFIKCVVNEEKTQIIK